MADWRGLLSLGNVRGPLRNKMNLGDAELNPSLLVSSQSSGSTDNCRSVDANSASKTDSFNLHFVKNVTFGGIATDGHRTLARQIRHVGLRLGDKPTLIISVTLIWLPKIVRSCLL